MRLTGGGWSVTDRRLAGNRQQILTGRFHCRLVVFFLCPTGWDWHPFPVCPRVLEHAVVTECPGSVSPTDGPDEAPKRALKE